jgi:hypothetical protein
MILQKFTMVSLPVRGSDCSSFKVQCLGIPLQSYFVWGGGGVGFMSCQLLSQGFLYTSFIFCPGYCFLVQGDSENEVQSRDFYFWILACLFWKVDTSAATAVRSMRQRSQIVACLFRFC